MVMGSSNLGTQSKNFLYYMQHPEELDAKIQKHDTSRQGHLDAKAASDKAKAEAEATLAQANKRHAEADRREADLARREQELVAAHAKNKAEIEVMKQTAYEDIAARESQFVKNMQDADLAHQVRLADLAREKTELSQAKSKFEAKRNEWLSLNSRFNFHE